MWHDSNVSRSTGIRTNRAKIKTFLPNWMQRILALCSYYRMPTADNLTQNSWNWYAKQPISSPFLFPQHFFLFLYYLQNVCSIRIHFAFHSFWIFWLFFLTVALLLFSFFFRFPFFFVCFVHIHRSILSSSPILILECSLCVLQWM